MVTTKFKAIVKQLNDAVAKGNSQAVVIIFTVPGYVDSFGEKKGDDQDFEVLAWNKKIPEIPKNLTVGSKCEVEAFINCKPWEQDEKKGYNTSLSLNKITVIV